MWRKGKQYIHVYNYYYFHDHLFVCLSVGLRKYHWLELHGKYIRRNFESGLVHCLDTKIYSWLDGGLHSLSALVNNATSIIQTAEEKLICVFFESQNI